MSNIKCKSLVFHIAASRSEEWQNCCTLFSWLLRDNGLDGEISNEPFTDKLIFTICANFYSILVRLFAFYPSNFVILCSEPYIRVPLQ